MKEVHRGVDGGVLSQRLQRLLVELGGGRGRDPVDEFRMLGGIEQVDAVYDLVPDDEPAGDQREAHGDGGEQGVGEG